jgi:uncharacterized membrane protein YkoI
MKENSGSKIIWGMLIASLFPTWASAKLTPPEGRISAETAGELARKYYNGKVQSEELEFENGKWIYSFDLKNPKDKKIHEVQIDALSGKLVNMHTETPADEKKESKEDQAAKSNK